MRKRHRPGWGWRVSNVGRAAPEAGMSRNHRFFNKSFNRNGTCRRLGFHRPGPGRGGEERGEEASTRLGRAGETTKDTRKCTRSDMAVLLNVIRSHDLPTSESCETSESGSARTIVRVAKCKMKVSESYETSESGPSQTTVRVDNSKTHICVSRKRGARARYLSCNFLMRI